MNSRNKWFFSSNYKIYDWFLPSLQRVQVYIFQVSEFFRETEKWNIVAWPEDWEKTYKTSLNTT